MTQRRTLSGRGTFFAVIALLSGMLMLPIGVLGAYASNEDRCLHSPPAEAIPLFERSFERVHVESTPSDMPIGVTCTFSAPDGSLVEVAPSWTPTILFGGGLALVLGSSALLSRRM